MAFALGSLPILLSACGHDGGSPAGASAHGGLTGDQVSIANSLTPDQRRQAVALYACRHRADGPNALAVGAGAGHSPSEEITDIALNPHQIANELRRCRATMAPTFRTVLPNARASGVSPSPEDSPSGS